MLIQVLMLTLFACPDPTTAADLGNPGPGGAAPGAPGGPGPTMDGPPPAPGDFNMADGAGVVVSGTLSYAGTQTGQLRIEFLATEDDAPPRLLHVEKLEAFGSFSVSTPPNTGPVALVAFVDVNGDGPSATDPAGLTRISIEETNLDGVELVLSDSPDLGDLTPGDAAPPTATDGAKGAASETPEIAVPTSPSPDAPTTPEAELAPPAGDEAPAENDDSE